MSKYITIRQLDGSETHLQLSDLPLTIGSNPQANLLLPETEPVIGYISESEGHLFIQPSDNIALPLFHNEFLLSNSAWLKSHDTLQTGDIKILYQKIGDRIYFTLKKIEKDTAPSSPPPLLETSPLPTEKPLRIPVKVAPSAITNKKKSLQKLVIAGLFLLLGFALLFVLMSLPLKIDIQPIPEKVAISGFPPALKIGSRYLGFPGTYVINAEKSGYHPIEESFHITREKENIFSVTLEKLPGIVHLNVTPQDGVEVYSKDNLVATTPPNTIKLAAGHHRLTFTKEKYTSVTKEFFVLGEGKSQNIDAVLEPDWATITISSQPGSSTVFIDGQNFGESPLTVDLASGKHRLVLTKESYTKKEAEIEVLAGKPDHHMFTLELLPGSLKINSKPNQAAVSINDEYKGMTPLNISLPSNKNHTLVLSKPGYLSATHKLKLGPGEDLQMELSLKRQVGVIFISVDPPQATLKINGKKAEKSQGNFTLPVNSHTFAAEAQGYKATIRTLTPNPAFGQHLTLRLEPLQTSPTEGLDEKQLLSFFITSTKQKLILVQPSSFIMGAPRREPGRRANERERRVDMQRPFYLAEKPVTNRDYRAFAKSHSSGNIAGFTLNGEDQPAVNVSWEEAVKYLNWLSQKDGLKPFYIARGNTFIPSEPLNNGYRLPTEAEWAYSARSLGYSNQLRFPWGGSFPPRVVKANYADEAARGFLSNILVGYNDRFPVTSPVGSFPANQGGFYDMGGNIGEWCHDYYTPYSGSLAQQVDPLGPSQGKHRVIRGASWRDASVTELRLSFRAYHREARDNVGFRIARYK